MACKLLIGKTEEEGRSLCLNCPLAHCVYDLEETSVTPSTNKENLAATHRRYYQDHKAEVAATHRRYYQHHKAEAAAQRLARVLDLAIAP